MRILSNPVETETKSDAQNENKQVGTHITYSLLCAGHIKLQYLNLILIFLARASVSYVQLNVFQLQKLPNTWNSYFIPKAVVPPSSPFVTSLLTIITDKSMPQNHSPFPSHMFSVG